MFNTVAFSVGAMMAGALVIGAALIVWLFGPDRAALFIGLAGGLLAGAGLVGMEWWLPRVFDARPRVDDLPHVAAAEGTLGAAA